MERPVENPYYVMSLDRHMERDAESHGYCPMGSSSIDHRSEPYRMTPSDNSSDEFIQAKADRCDLMPYRHNGDILHANGGVDQYRNHYQYHNGCPIDGLMKADPSEDPYCFVDEEFGHGRPPPSLSHIDLSLATHSPVFPKKRGRKKKSDIANGYLDVNGLKPEVAVKERKKYDRFNGMSEEEVKQRTLPDHIALNLDILIVGINPGLFAAYKGHHYAGPGNHFWKCMYMSGLIPHPMTAEDDGKLLQFGMGFTNIVSRPTRGSQDITKEEILEGGQILLEKVRKFKPKIVVFNGKGIFEVFSGKKDFMFGKQPEPIEGANSIIWVMPSSSARCAQLPRAVDKVPFYVALKKLRDYLNGLITEIDESEMTFSECALRSFADSKLQELGIKSEIKDEICVNGGTDFGEGNYVNNGNGEFLCPGTSGALQVPPKKKRGRPKKIRTEGEGPLDAQPVKAKYKPRKIEYGPNGEPIKKKRGRPKKIRPEEGPPHLTGPPSWHPAGELTPYSDPLHGPYGPVNGMLSPLHMNPNAFSPPYGQRGTPNAQYLSQQPPNGMNPDVLDVRLQSHLKSPQRYPSTPNPMGDLSHPEPPASTCSSSSSFHHSPASQNISGQSPPSSQSYAQSDYSSQLAENISSPHNLDTPPPASPSLGPADFSPPASMPAEENDSQKSSKSSSSLVPLKVQSSDEKTNESYQTAQASRIGDEPCSFSNPTTPGSGTVSGSQSLFGNYSRYRSQSSSETDIRYPGSAPPASYEEPSKEDSAPDVSTKSLSGLESLVDQIPSIGDPEGASTHPVLSNPGSAEHYSPLHAENSQSPDYGPSYGSSSYPSHSQYNTPVSDYSSPSYSTASTNFSISSLAHSSVNDDSDAPNPSISSANIAQSPNPLHSSYSVSSLASSSSVSSYYNGNSGINNYPGLIGASSAHSVVSSGYGMSSPGSITSMDRFMNNTSAMGLAAGAMSSMHSPSLSPYASAYSQYSSSASGYNSPGPGNFPYSAASGFHVPSPHYPYGPPYGTNPYQASYQNPMGFGGF